MFILGLVENCSEPRRFDFKVGNPAAAEPGKPSESEGLHSTIKRSPWIGFEGEEEMRFVGRVVSSSRYRCLFPP